MATHSGTSGRARNSLLAMLLAAALLPAGPAAVGAATGAGTQRPPFHPTRLSSVGDSTQVVVVTSGSWTSSRARLRAYERSAAGTWRLRLGPVDATIGRNGFAPARTRRQGTRTTPAGTFALPWAFGTRVDPGAALRYRRVDRNDWWPYDPTDPSTYNVWQDSRPAAADWRTSWAEDLSSYGRQYRYAAVVDFNLPSGLHREDGERVADAPADTRRGGGIFLHVNRPGPTTGCISITQADMVTVLRWLDPAKDPLIVMGPRSAITRM